MLSEYTYKANYIKINDEQMHYVDEGQGEVILMVHGNPTWSYFYRNIIKFLSKSYRCIAIDHIGCGRSSKPQEYNYTLEQRITDLEKLVEHLKLKDITLIVHDWGGAIGLGFATRHPDLIKKIVITNTAAFPDKFIPKRINILKFPLIGEWSMRALNSFAWPATFMTTNRPLKPEIKAGYLSPYNNYQNRIAIARFVQDIPMTPAHPSFDTLKEVGERLQRLQCPILLLWGKNDFCFTLHFFDRFKKIFPKAKTKVLEAGHYLFEDALEESLTEIEAFL
jgi:haloalkane dehalogenase